jgi:predicted deacylase
MAFEAAKDGKIVVSAWIGGGPGLRDHREDDMDRIKKGVLNAMKHLGMLSGDVEFEQDEVSVIEAHTVLKLTGERGLTFIDKNKRGQTLEAGEKIGYVEHPYSGDILQEITAPRSGVMLHAGASWPILPEDATLAILGDLVGIVKAG